MIRFRSRDTISAPGAAQSSALRRAAALGRHAPRVEMDGHVKQALDMGRTRLVITSALFFLAFSVVGLRLLEVMALNQGQEPRAARTADHAPLHMERADILDRNGVLLATNLATASLYANPEMIFDAADAARKLVRVLPDLAEAEVRAKLSSERSFVWLRRNLTPRQQYEVNRLGVPGFQFLREERRIYPHGPIVSHVLGLADVDNNGIAGIEKSLDDAIRGGTDPIRLSIDVRVQSILRTEILKQIAAFRATGGAGLMLDVRSGEVIAMVSLPDFDPNTPSSLNPDTTFNRTTLGVYEMGSTFKTFTTAQALDIGVVTLEDGYDASEPIRVARFTITDFKPKKRFLTVPEIFMYSSNIGTAKMALDIGAERQRAFLGQLGLLTTPSIELPEVGSPLVPAYWRDIATMTISYGHGVSVTPLQLASAVGAVVNGGELHPATLLKRGPRDHPASQRVISPATSETMRNLLRLVVERGTGSKAAVPGYRIGGKTGTSEKAVNGRYEGSALLSSFVAAFPIDDPRYAVVVMVDDPKGNKDSFGYATGGWTAAPVVAALVRQAAPLLGVAPEHTAANPAFDDLLTHVSTADH